MFSPQKGDVILQSSFAGAFVVLDALSMRRVTGPLPLQEAVGVARRLGAPNIFQQAVDGRGRLLFDPQLLERAPSVSRTSLRVLHH